MLAAVLPAAVKSGVCIAASRRFLIPCGKEPMIGCNTITASRTGPVNVVAPPAYCFDASSKLMGNSFGKFFFGLGSFLAGTGFAATGCGAALATGAGATGLGAGAGCPAGFSCGTLA